jgi:hypothetical protein
MEFSIEQEMAKRVTYITYFVFVVIFAFLVFLVLITLRIVVIVDGVLIGSLVFVGWFDAVALRVLVIVTDLVIRLLISQPNGRKAATADVVVRSTGRTAKHRQKH